MKTAAVTRLVFKAVLICTGMIRKIVSLLVVLSLFVYASGQVKKPGSNEVERAYESFKKDFNKELGIVDEPSAGKPASDQNLVWHSPVKLPDWLFSHAASSQNSTFAIGISDPGLDTLIALRQARLRALAMIALANNNKVQNISDNYYYDQAGRKTLGKFNSFSNITGEAWFAENNVELLNMFYTTNQEMIIAISVKGDPKNQKACHHIRCNIEFFQSEKSFSAGSMLLNRTMATIEETNCKNEITTFEWLQNSAGNSADITSLLNQQPLPAIAGNFKYLMPGTPKNEEPEKNGFAAEFDLTSGLWNAYIHAYVSQLENMDVFNSQVKYLDDSFDKQFQDLTRVISSNSIHPKPVSFYVRDNKLVMETIK